jgi:glyoxylase-like metal-dependent hydrolase (beta-lactamase superfamily II)
VEIKVLPLGSYGANCTVVWVGEKKAWIFDPGADGGFLLDFLKRENRVPARVFLTHAHFDHIGALPALLRHNPQLPVYVGAGDVPFFGHPFNANPPDYPRVERPQTLWSEIPASGAFSADGLTVRFFPTPGHTPGGTCFYFAEDSLLVAGDTLCAGSVGRTDLPGGDVKTLMASIDTLRALPPQTRVVCGHGPDTTLAREWKTNPFLV